VLDGILRHFGTEGFIRILNDRHAAAGLDRHQAGRSAVERPR
jgi:hypothetical protein